MARRTVVRMIVVDSNVWIFAEDASSDRHGIAAAALKRTVESDEIGLTPIIVSEVFHSLSRIAGPGVARQRVMDILEDPSCAWLSLTAQTAKAAMILAEKSSVKINDALIAQQAIEIKASVLTDNVKDFRKVRGLKVIPL